MHNSIPHGSWERDGLGLTVIFHYGGIDSKARPHVFSRLKHTDVWQQEEAHGGAMLIPWQPEQEDLINDWKGFHLERDFALIEKKKISLGSIPADVFALIWCFMFQYHTLQTVNDLIYQSWCVPWCQILLNPEGLFHFTKHYLWIKALQMQPEVWLLLLMININIKVRLKPKCFCIIERKQNVWVPDSQFPGCLQKFNAPRFIVNYWKWSNTIIRYVANEQHVKYLSNWRYKLFTACTAAGTASYVLRDLCRELGGSHEEPLDDVCFPFPHIAGKICQTKLNKTHCNASWIHGLMY